MHPFVLRRRGQDCEVLLTIGSPFCVHLPRESPALSDRPRRRRRPVKVSEPQVLGEDVRERRRRGQLLVKDLASENCFLALHLLRLLPHCRL